VQLALIPPKGLYRWTSRGDLDMSLAHMVADEEYRRVYSGLSTKRFLMLDNGEAEGAQVSPERLMTVATTLGADEVVLPDVIGDGTATVDRVKKFLLNLQGPVDSFKFMAVAQGLSSVTVKRTIEAFAELEPITTIGIPRWLVNPDRYSIRIDIAGWIAEKYPERFQVHFLGTSVEWVREIYFAAKYQVPVRSVDTSMPFNYAIANCRLQNDNNYKIKRPSDYFDKSFYHVGETSTLRHNVDVMKRWARGE
jgi:hypothetical protein